MTEDRIAGAFEIALSLRQGDAREGRWKDEIPGGGGTLRVRGRKGGGGGREGGCNDGYSCSGPGQEEAQSPRGTFTFTQQSWK